MAIATYFMAAPAPGKDLTLPDLETLAADLLQHEWVRLPGAILVGGVAYEPRYTDIDEDERTSHSRWEGLANFSRWVEPHFIVPNRPGLIERKASDLIWYKGDEKRAYLEALHGVPFGEQTICLCFDKLAAQLKESRWGTAAICVLTQPAFIDFVEPHGYDAARLIHRGVTFFFTLSSNAAGRFPDLEDNPLKPVLERSFGIDLEMAQTPDTYY